MSEKYELWVQNYDTFGESDSYIHATFEDIELAKAFADSMKGWGRRTWINTADESRPHYSQSKDELLATHDISYGYAIEKSKVRKSGRKVRGNGTHS